MTGIAPGMATSLAHSLEPVLRRSCDDRLGQVAWFRTDWQRGGAATGRADWLHEDGSSSQVVVKCPVIQREYLWTRRLQGAGGVVPRLLASGTSLDEYDLAWVVIEHLPTGPLGCHWDQGNIARMAKAAAEFTKATEEFDIDQDIRREDWVDLLKRARDSAKRNRLESTSSWTKRLKLLLRHVKELQDEWVNRQPIQWLHGDFHLANAMARSDQDDSDVVLIDLAEVHAGHWLEDAVYLERQLWARPERLDATKPVREMASARRHCGLPVADDYAHLADIRRLFLAATAPAFMQSEGDPRYIAACRGQLEQSMDRLGLLA
ncbi:MAG: aminoglycoside phosphotransferase family protein [Phycisphaerales bacterium]|nr:aminoglycoside phosphotransferase family protein [Phycisphaerales bacterium]